MSFLRLPGELRNTIYEFILLHPEPIDPCFDCDSQVFVGLFRASKTVHREASLIFYGRNRFDFGGCDPEKLASFLRQIGPRNAGSIRHIVIDFPEFRYLDPGDIALDEESIRTLRNISSSCTSLGTLTTSLHSTHSMECRLDNLEHHKLATEALHLVDTQLRAIPSLPEIILEVSEDAPSDHLRNNMESYGWILSKKVFMEEEYPDRGLSDYGSDDYHHGYDYGVYDGNDSYDDDDYDIDNDSDFWRRAAD